jgi:uncharacterized protein
MLYLDTSLLVGALTNEARSPSIQRWLEDQDPAGLTISWWVVAEFSAALSVKLRTGQLGARDRSEALVKLEKLMDRSLSILPVAQSDFTTAARLADQYQFGLRAADALHLAIAANHGATLNRLDKRLAEAGATLGVATTLL